MIHNLRIQFIFVGIFLVVSLGGFIWLYDEIKETEFLSEANLKTWHIEAARRDEIKSLNNIMKGIENERAELEEHFVPVTNPVPLLDSLEKMASRVGAKNDIISVEVSKDGKTFFVSMNPSGSFEAFYKFLTLLENSTYDMEFVSMNMGKEGDGNVAGGLWSAVLKVKVLTFIK